MEPEYAHHYLYPGAIFANRIPHKVTTILGTCVAVCLWDPVLRQGGINHFLLPFWNGEGLASPKYGNIAIQKLMERMIALGSNPVQLQAKLFGGKSNMAPDTSVLNVGDRNVRLAEEILKDLQIPVISTSLGGAVGRKLIFNTWNGDVLMKQIPMK